MMKQKYFALAAACAVALALTGCSAGRNDNSAEPVAPTNSLTADSNDRASAGVPNDAAQGGGAGGTNAKPENSYHQNNVPGSESMPSDGDGLVDDIGDAAGDVARGAGDMVRGAGNAIGDAAGDVDRAMR